MEPINQTRTYPFYIKASVILFGVALLVYILNVLGDILVPFAIATLIAILLNPLNNRIQRRLPRVLSILATILIALILIGGLLYFLSTQIYLFTRSIPLLKQKFGILLIDVQHWVELHFGISIKNQIQVLKSAINDNQHFVSNTLGTIAGTFGIIVLIPVYVFLILFYKPLILNFLYQVFLERNSLRVAEILFQTKRAIQSYMIGLLLETAIVSILYSIALLIIGVPYALVLGLIGGLLNLLPYIGGLIALLLAVLAATISYTGFSTQIVIIAAYILIQFIDNNLLVPRIVSSKVKINALISLMIILLGGKLWGIPGLFLSIPFIAVLKIIFDRIDELKPWGRLLGDEIPSEHIGVVWQKRWDRIFKRTQKKSM